MWCATERAKAQNGFRSARDVSRTISSVSYHFGLRTRPGTSRYGGFGAFRSKRATGYLSKLSSRVGIAYRDAAMYAR